MAEIGPRLILTAAQANALKASASVVSAASAGVAAPGRAVTWSGATTLPSGEGFIIATLTGDTTLSLPKRGVNAETINLLIKQDSTGARTLKLLGAAVAEGFAYTPTETPGAIDLITLTWTGSMWLAFVGATNLLIPAEWVI